MSRDSAIRILHTHPFFWPHVRRGAEREIHDLSERLVRRGHDVRLVTSTPVGITQRADVDGIDVRYVRPRVPAALRRRGVGPEMAFVPVAAAASAVSRADLVHAWMHHDAAGALAGNLGRSRPVVLKITGVLYEERLAKRRREDRLFRWALDRADAVWCNSDYVRTAMAPFGRDLDVVPAGIDADRFTPGGVRADEPLVVCAAAPDEPRKRVVDLVDAWPAVLAAAPTARLVLAGHTSEATRGELLDRLPGPARDTVEFAGLVDDDRLLTLYRRAWATVVPSVYEALGLVTLESLACGTPVVGCDSGATPELLHDPAVGRLFAPADPAGLAAALVDLVASPPDDAVGQRCRAAAMPWSWDEIVPDIERRYRTLLEAS